MGKNILESLPNQLATFGRDVGAVALRTLPGVVLLSADNPSLPADKVLYEYTMGIGTGIANYASRRWQRSNSGSDYDRNPTLDEVESFLVGANVILINMILHQTDMNVQIAAGLGLVALNAVALYSVRGYQEP